MRHRILTAVLCAIVVLAAGAASSANFVIVNGDAAGEGLNDPTPVDPVRGNPGGQLSVHRA